MRNKDNVKICKYCLYRQAVKCNGIFKFNGEIEEKDDYCQQCAKQIIFYFCNLDHEETEVQSDINIARIIEQKCYNNGLLVCDTSLISDEEVDRIHNKIKNMAKNVKRL